MSAPGTNAAGVTGDRRQLVIFSLGGEQYALPIQEVNEIIRYTEPRSVVSGSAWIRGVIGLRGKIIPIYDLGARLGLMVESAPEEIVIVDCDDHQVGIMVDDVDEVITVSADDLDEMPGGGSECVQGIAKLGDRLVMLLDPAGLFSTELAGF
jgi:purine-binding chemotaxis protein CheW